MSKGNRIFPGLPVVLLFIGTLASCRETPQEELNKEILFKLDFGKMEDQINLHEENSLPLYRKNRVFMKGGFFYIGNSFSGKVMEFNSYGNILNLYYNEEMNPEPVLLSRNDGSDLTATRNLYVHPFLDVGEIAVGQNKKLFVDDQIAENRWEFDEELGTMLDRIILQFDRDGRFIDYLGQEGSGGTPFPYVEKIRITDGDELVVFSRYPEGRRVFWFSADGRPLYVIDIQQARLPVPDAVMAPDVVPLLETLEVDPSNRLLYAKVDYYAESIAQNSEDGNSFGGSYVWWLDVAKGSYGGSVRIPENQRELEKPSIHKEKVIPLMYQLIGVTRGGHLYLMSLQGRNSYKLTIMNVDGLIVKSGVVNYGDDRLLMMENHLSPEGILSVLLFWEWGVEMAWWRADRFLPQVGP